MADGAPNERPGVRDWLDGLDADVRGQAEDLAALIGAADPRLDQAVKWGRLTFTVSGDWHHWLCGIAATKKGAKVVFHKGVLLEDPHRLLTGSGRYVREVPAEVALAAPEAITDLVGNAVTHQTDMLD